MRKRAIIYGAYSPPYENINENWTAATFSLSLSLSLSCSQSCPDRVHVSPIRARKFVTRQITRIHFNAAVDEQIPGTRQPRPVNKIYKRHPFQTSLVPLDLAQFNNYLHKRCNIGSYIINLWHLFRRFACFGRVSTNIAFSAHFFFLSLFPPSNTVVSSPCCEFRDAKTD